MELFKTLGYLLFFIFYAWPVLFLRLSTYLFRNLRCYEFCLMKWCKTYSFFKGVTNTICKKHLNNSFGLPLPLLVLRLAYVHSAFVLI